MSELALALKRTLEDSFGYVRVRGEISGYRGPHASGHAYFALKDATARIDAVVWRTTFARMRVKPEEGLEVVATGKITSFPAKSTYQIVVESLEPAGAGALMALLETRRRKLAAEGVFESHHKRPLPFLPRVVGVITSPTGAVIRDIIHRLTDRFPTRVVIWPVRVQGEGSAEEIAAAIRGMNALPGNDIPRPDVLLVARGGGSLEDLWSFNDEDVIRAAADGVIPLVSAVGHETDWTLLDHVADVRAPTPTAAAELCVPVRSDLLSRVARSHARGAGAIERLVQRQFSALRSVARTLPSLKSIPLSARQRLDGLDDGLQSALNAKTSVIAVALAKCSTILAKSSPAAKLITRRERLRSADSQLSLALGKRHSSLLQSLKDKKLALQFVISHGSERVSQSVASLRLRWGNQRNSVGRQHLASKAKLDRLEAALRRSLENGLRRKEASAMKLGRVFSAVNYRAILGRGFALVFDEAGDALTTANDAQRARMLTVSFADGEVSAAVKARPTRRRTRKTSEDVEQKSLF